MPARAERLYEQQAACSQALGLLRRHDGSRHQSQGHLRVGWGEKEKIAPVRGVWEVRDLHFSELAYISGADGHPPHRAPGTHHPTLFSPTEMYSTRGIEAVATVTELRSRTSALIDQAKGLKTGIMIQKNNEPEAVLIGYELYLDLFAAHDKSKKAK